MYWICALCTISCSVICKFIFSNDQEVQVKDKYNIYIYTYKWTKGYFKNKLFQGMENCEHFPWAIHHLEEKKTYKSY